MSKKLIKKNNSGSVMQSKKAQEFIATIIQRPGKIDTIDVADYRSGVNTAKTGSRVKLYNLYENVLADPVLADAVDKLVGAVTNAEIMFQMNGESVEEMEDLMDTAEFERLLKEIALKFVWGKSLIECSFNPDFNVFSIPRKNIRITNLDKPLSERKKFIAVKETDNSGYDYTQDEFIIECGDDDDLGLLFRASLHAIYKRGGWGDWAQFIEIFAMPFIVGEYEGFDENTQKQLFNALASIGSNPYAAVPKGVKLQVHANNSGSSGTNYENFTDKCDRQMLIAILGNTMTTMEGSSRAQGEVHQQTQDERFKMIRRYTQRVLNQYFLPLLIKRGYKVAGGFFSFPDAGESITTGERLDMALKMRAAGLPVDVDYFFEITGMGKAEDKQEATDNKTPEPKKEDKLEEPAPEKKEIAEPKEPKQAKEDIKNDDEKVSIKLLDRIFNFFSDAPMTLIGAYRNLSAKWNKNTSGNIKLADDYSINIDKLINEAIKEVYGDRAKQPELVNKNLFDITNKPLQDAIDTELKDLVQDNPEFIRQFKENTAVFSAFKNHQQTQAFVDALRDEEGKIRSFYKFEKECRKIGEKFNRQYLQTEYNTLIRALRISANLKKYEQTLHLYPNLEYIESNAANPRKSHKEYIGTILPFYHAAWAWLMPPSEWNCDCSVRPTDKEPTEAPEKPDGFDPIFDNNPVVSASFVNTPETPYYKHTKKALHSKIEQEAKRLLKEAENEAKKGK
jgi:hypothetical protein